MDRIGLGKGLSALIPGASSSESGILEVEITSIALNPRQPRRNLDESSISELCASIKQQGIIQPLVVRPTGPGRYELVAGERRLRAAKAAGLTTVPVILRALDDRQSLEIALVENLQREDINAIDAALAYKKLSDEFHLSQDEIANRVGKSRSAVANTLRLLQLPASVQRRVEKGELSEGHARALLTITNPNGQVLVADEVVRKQLSVRDTERLARSWNKDLDPNRSVSRETHTVVHKQANLLAVEEHLRNLFKTRVRIIHNEERGKIEIEFYGEEDLNRILALIGAIPANSSISPLQP